VLFRIVKDNKTEDDTETYDGLITDISGGGMGLLTDEELDVGTRIECSISVQDMLDVTVQGIVVRTDESGDTAATDYKYVTGILFDKINESKRREIIQFIFEIQRKRIRDKKFRNL
jgi:c-di-GMP-binding flagellar brake protein YcgR